MNMFATSRWSDSTRDRISGGKEAAAKQSRFVLRARARARVAAS